MDAFKGILLTLTTPRLWPLCLGPLVGAVLLYVVLGVGAGILLTPHLQEWLRNYPFWAQFAELGAVLLWIILFPFYFTLFGGVFFGFVFEPLSREVERLIAPQEKPGQEVRMGCGAAFGDTTARLCVNALLAVTALLLGLFLGPIPGLVAAAIVGLLDYTAPAFLRRGLTLRAQSRRLFRNMDSATLSFAAVAGFLSLVPLLGVFLMPGLIAGGTLLAHRRLSQNNL
jgi:CysZ protein